MAGWPGAGMGFQHSERLKWAVFVGVCFVWSFLVCVCICDLLVI